ncbi:MAG: cell wall-binding repeat-containing protein [Anaerosomatales bacterium]|nr:cell wall-binding repeat-containing protein [Anaerosomatales bacterium]
MSAEIDRLGATQAFIVGGTGVVGTGVETALNGKPALSGNVHRISGLDRYETARKVAEAMHDAAGPPLGNAIVVCGTNFADGLAASPLSYADRRPILLTPPTYAHPQMLGALASIEATNVVIVGGTGAVGSTVQTTLGNRPGISEVRRCWGDTRFDTAAAVAEHCIDADILTRDFVGYALGRDFPDGLAGGVAGKAGGALLLTESWVEPESTQFFNFDCAGITTTARVFGGPGVVWGSILGMVNDDLFGGF